VWFEGSTWQSYTCKNTGCDVPATAKKGALGRCVAQTALERFWSVVKTSLVGEEHSRYFTAASRGLEGDLKEAVVSLAGSQVDITSTMADLPAAAYRVHFEALSDGARMVAPVQVQWLPGRPALVSAAGLKPGLYRLALLEESGEPTGSESWILFRNPQEYSETSAAFQEVVKTVASWPAEADPSAIRAVLRASLEALAKQGKDSGKP
jgi:hypothetical protein